jgi:hypothetical protein
MGYLFIKTQEKKVNFKCTNLPILYKGKINLVLMFG